jgi:hypothetical protein
VVRRILLSDRANRARIGAASAIARMRLAHGPSSAEAWWAGYRCRSPSR